MATTPPAIPSPTSPARSAELERDRRSTLLSLPLATITTSPLNPRKTFAQHPLDELVESIKQLGVVQPIVVRPATGSGPANWEIVAGERRYRAALAAGLETIPAICRQDLNSNTAALEVAITENLHRENLDPIEQAQAYSALADLGLTQAAIAERAGLSQPSVANQLRLLKLPPHTRELLASHKLTAAHGVALARLAAYPAVVDAIADEAIQRGSSSKDLSRGLPHAYHLRDAGLAASLDWGGLPGTSDACKSCPCRVDGWCVDPDRYTAQQQRLADERRVAAAAASAGLTDDPAQPVDYEHLVAEHISFAWVGRSRPTGCTSSCPCARTTPQGDAICLDPERLAELRRAGTAAAERALAERRSTISARITAHVASLEPRQVARELATLAHLAVSQLTVARVAELARTYLPTLATPTKLTLFRGYPDRARTAELLAATDGDALTLLRLAVAAALTDEAAAGEHRDPTPTPWLDWLEQGRAAPTAPEPKPERAPRWRPPGRPAPKPPAAATCYSCHRRPATTDGLCRPCGDALKGA